MKVFRAKACGNSPKSRRAEDIAVIFLKRDIKKLSSYISPDFVLKTAPIAQVKADDLKEFFKNFPKGKVAQVEFVVTHGKYAAVQFALKGQKPSHFCLTMEAASPSFKKFSRMSLFRL